MRSPVCTSALSSRLDNHRFRRFISRHPVPLISLALMAALLAATIGSFIAGAGAAGFISKQDFGPSAAYANAGAVVAPPPASLITVNSTEDASPSVSGDGKCTLREAITNANSDSDTTGGDCAAGSGTDTINFDIAGAGPFTIQLTAALPNISQSVNITNASGKSITVRGQGAANPYSIFRITSSGSPTVTMSNLTITNGNADGGGGIRSDANALTLTNCIVTGNTATVGGGIFSGGTLTLTNSTVSGNAATADGGGIDILGTLIVTNSTISNNSTNGPGGGIYVRQFTQVTVTNSTISGNSAATDGGGIYTEANVPLTMTNSTVSGNSANGNGGGIQDGNGNGGQQLSLTGVTITNNRADADNNASGTGGGIGGLGFSPILLRDSILAGNYRGAGTATADDYAILGCPSVTGGSSFNLIGADSSGCFTNGANNNQVGVGNPGLAPLGNNGGPTQTHHLLSGSPAIDKGSLFAFTTLNSSINNSQTTFQTAPPVTGPNPFTPGMVIRIDNEQMVVVSSPPCGPAGCFSSVTVTVTRGANGTTAAAHAGGASIFPVFDQRGRARTFDDPSITNASDGTDIGAYEVQDPTPQSAPSFVVNSPDDHDDGGANACTVGDCTLREAINAANANPGSTITFSITGTISLLTALPNLSSDMTIQGPGANLLTVQRSTAGGTPNFRVFTINSGKTVGISGLTISNGNATSGGGIVNSGTLTVSNSTISGNSAPGNIGGGVYNNGNANTAVLTVVNSTISGNNAEDGAGIFNNTNNGGSASLTIINSTISGNSATRFGGGIRHDNGPLVLTNVTITNNRADADGDSIGDGGGFRTNGNTVTLSNTIAAGNFVGASPGTTASNIDNTIVSGSSSNNLIGGTPLLGSLQNNGGATQTHALLVGSPAIDAGNNALVTNPPFSGPPFTDQRGTGFSRIVDGDANTTDTVDIGAFEVQLSVEDITDKATNEDTQLQFTFNVGGGANITSVTAASSNTTLVPNNAANIAVTGSGSTRTLTINPAANLFGTSTITVTVNGNNNTSVTDTFVLTVNAVADTPSVTNASTTVNTQTASGLVISRNLADGAEVTNFKITNITNGTLFKNNGTTQISDNDFITVTEGNAGLKFTPALNSNANGSFQAQASLSNTDAGLGGGVATATITVSCGPTVVTNSNDSGAGSLRDVILHACDGATITFQVGLSNVALTSAELLVDKNLTIQGPGANLLTVRRSTAVGTPNFRIFRIGVGGAANISGLTISNGNASGDIGGGILSNGSLTLTDSTVSGNTSQNGGGIYLLSPSATTNMLNRVTVTNNIATSAGGGVSRLGGTTTIINALIANNSANSGRGGGIGTNGNDAFTIVNSTISGNSSGHDGGGIDSFSPNLRLTNVTITNNRTDSDNNGSGLGGGFKALGPSNTVTVNNTIIAGNFSGAGSTADDINAGLAIDTVNSFNNLFGTGYFSTANGNQIGVTNPLLGALANNGGPTLTHALLLGSPAIDTGNNSKALDQNNAALTTDQRGAGFARIVDGPDADTVDTVDIGAFEAQVSVEDITDKTTNEDTQLQFTFNVGGGASITSVTATSSNTTLVPNNAANITVSGSGSTRTLTINPAANQFGASTITVTVNGPNSQSMTDTFVLTVNPVADTPSVTNATTNEDTQTTSGLVISRNPADGAEVTHFKITSIANGTLFQNDGTTQINNGDFITVAQGAAGLKFTPAADSNANGSFQVQASLNATNAGLGGGLATATITVNPVNDAPTLNPIGNLTINEDAGLQTVNLTGISAGGGESQTLVITATSNNTGVIPNPTVTYTSPNANGSLTFTPVANAGGSAIITVTVTDNGGTANGGVNTVVRMFTVTVNAVNDAPSFTKGPDQTIQDPNPQSVPNWATNISAGPPDETAQTLTFLVSNNNHALFSAQPAISLSGTLTFTAAAGTDGVATVTVQLKDNGGTANGGVDTSAAQTFTLTVHALNNAPTLDALGNVTINEEAPLQTVNLSGITPGPNFESNQTLTVTATSNNTALIPNPSVSYTSPNGTGSISFTPVPNANGSALITVTVKDNGGTLNGGVDTFSRTFTVTVNPINDAPVNNVPGAQNIPLNASFVFSAATGNAISISDVDAGSDPVQVTLKATDGTLTLNGTSGLSFSAGDGTDDPLMTFTGSIANINAALEGMKNLALGSGVIQITTNDLGRNGAGGPLSDIDTIAVTVNDNLPPQLLTAAGTDRAIAFDSVTFVVDPFSLLGSNNFTADHRTHITLFALHAQLRPGETLSAITAEADVAGTTVPLIVESVMTVPNFDWLTQIVVKFPDGFSTGGGGPHDAKIRIRLRSQNSNQAVIIIVPAPKP